MKNNAQQHESFASIISKEEYEELDNPELFKIENKVIIPQTYSIKMFDDSNELYTSSGYITNPLLVDEIYNTFLLEKKIEDNCEYNNHIEKITIKLKTAINDKNKLQILKKEFKKYSSKLNKIDLIENLYNIDKTLNTKNPQFINLVKNTISFEDEIYIDFITEGYNMNFYNHYIFDEWNKLDLYFEIQNFIKTKIDYFEAKISSNQSTTNNNITTSNNEEYFNEIFKSAKAEHILLRILNEKNVIDNKNKAKRGFQPICNAFFHTLDKYRKYLIKDKVSLKMFAIYLNKIYESSIPINDKVKLSSGEKYKDDVNKLISIYIDELKEEKEIK